MRQQIIKKTIPNDMIDDYLESLYKKKLRIIQVIKFDQRTSLTYMTLLVEDVSQFE